MARLYKAALRRAAARHALILPIWLGRAAAEGITEGAGILLAVMLDAMLSFLHRRANRLVEHDYWDQFGQHDSLTKAYYVPEAFCVYLIVRDTIYGIVLLREWL